jgi:hypothetical protein
MKFILFVIVLVVNLFAINWLEYINTTRNNLHLPQFYESDLLNESASNHSFYLAYHNVASNKEDKLKMYYTGFTPLQRCKYIGYDNCYESFSTNNKDTQESIDMLLGSIYDRFLFLSPYLNEIGLGANEDGYSYVYNFGSYENSHDKNSSSMIIYPYNKAINIPPITFYQTLNPLKSYKFMGYPISVEFDNRVYVKIQNIKIILLDENNKVITTTKLISKDNDPYVKLTEFQYVLLPLQRLNWGSFYQIDIAYDAILKDGSLQSKRIKQTFSTKNYPYEYYIITPKTKTIDIISNKNYILYFNPLNNQDINLIKKINHNNQVFINRFKMLDYHTFSINISGDIGNSIRIIKNDGQNIDIIIRHKDNANLVLKPTKEE